MCCDTSRQSTSSPHLQAVWLHGPTISWTEAGGYNRHCSWPSVQRWRAWDACERASSMAWWSEYFWHWGRLSLPGYTLVLEPSSDCSTESYRLLTWLVPPWPLLTWSSSILQTRWWTPSMMGVVLAWSQSWGGIRFLGRTIGAVWQNGCGCCIGTLPRKEFRPVVLPLIDEQLKVLLQLLVHPFCLLIALMVISCSSHQLNPKRSVEFPSELCYELRASVRHNPPR